METSIETNDISQAVLALLEKLPRPIPISSYRFQFNADFTFADAQRIVPYLAKLGISDAYASPLQMPRATSTHGYDIVDHSLLSPMLGGEEAFEPFSTTLREHDLGLLIDVVPNHMGIGDKHNQWWIDVLENGPSSIYASYFDIDWDPVSAELKDKVLLPVLGDQYGNVLEQGELKLNYEDGAFFVSYYDNIYPLAPGTYDAVLSYKLADLLSQLGDENPGVQELQSIITAVSYLPERTEPSPDKIAERNREKEIIKRRLANLHESSADIRAALDETMTVFNGTVGQPASFDLLDALIDRQAYRLAFWRVAAEEINYRRFFDINDLAAIRVELPPVLEDTHRLIFDLLSAEKATGLRIDHPDGLWNPLSYFRQLQEHYLLTWVRDRLPAEPEPDLDAVLAVIQAWLDSEFVASADATSEVDWPLYVVAEKILSEDEGLPLDWAVAGTTGYDFLADVNGIFVETDNRKAFDRIYNTFTDETVRFGNLVNTKKKEIMLVSLASEINSLSHELERIAEKNRRYRDFTLNSLTFTIREVIAELPVYRTYVTENGEVAPWDEQFVETAINEARRRNPRTAEAIFEFIRDTLLLRNLNNFSEEDQASLLHFVMKFQQITGPAMAKGVEDTSFYVYNRLVSLNEVGGHPEYFGTTLSTFHQRNKKRNRRWPHSMLCLSTHDTKRSEDVRARISVLSEMPREWGSALTRWSRQNARKRTTVKQGALPDRNDEYLFYQTLIGAWPMTDGEDFAEFRERIAAYMHKATKEAKVHTTWINPNEQYDTALREFVMQVLDQKGRNPFLANFVPFQQRIAFYGRFNSLAQTLCKLTAPGMPDTYQGTEMWDLSLVDPDNRRPVDYAQRDQLLDAMQQRVADDDELALAQELLDHAPDGRIKLYVTYRALHLRRDHVQLFTEGKYQQINPTGAQSEHVIAFARTTRDETAIVVAPRLVVKLTEGVEQPPIGEAIWRDTWLPLPNMSVGDRFRNLFTGEELTVSERDGDDGLALAAILAHFPVALLVRSS